ncbi:hypothetical protein RV18_GL003588 [Enterococcus termitis]|jgi:hypothetical protein|nr:hypothetical protein RV18_GL003588 [Enterococcus termitis]
MKSREKEYENEDETEALSPRNKKGLLLPHRLFGFQVPET